MKKLCAKQNRRAKQWEFSQSVRKLFAMCCEFRNAKNHSEFRNAKFRNAKTTLQISQCEKPHCEFRNAKNHCEFRNAKFRNAKTTLQISQCEKPHCEFRNAKNHCEFRNAKFRNAKTTLQISQCEKKISQCQMVANRLRKFMFFFFSSDFQYMLQNLHKTSKIKAIKIA